MVGGGTRREGSHSVGLNIQEWTVFPFKAVILPGSSAAPGFILVGNLAKLICLFLPVSSRHDIEVLCSAKVFLKGDKPFPVEHLNHNENHF